MVALFQVELTTQAVNLGNLSFMQCAFVSLKHTAGIGHRFVKEQRIEIVAQVVMRVDVASATVFRIFLSLVPLSSESCYQSNYSAIARIGDVDIAAEYFDDVRRAV